MSHLVNQTTSSLSYKWFHSRNLYVESLLLLLLLSCPYRYLYLGQYDTVDAAVAARDAAMLVLYGPGAIAAHGPAWVSTTAAADAAVEGSAAAAAVLDMAARLMKKDNVPGEMKDNGTEYLLDLVRERQQQQQKEGLEKTAAAERKAA